MTDCVKDADTTTAAARVEFEAPVEFGDCVAMGAVTAAGNVAPSKHTAAAATKPGAVTTTAVVSLPHEWTTGLFDCFQDQRSCADATFCRPCQASRQFNMLTHGSNDIHLTTCVCVPAAAVVCVAPVVMPVFVSLLRKKTRLRYGIEGSIMGDFFASLFCEPCALAQQHREMALRGDWTSGEFVTRPFALRVLPVAQME